MAAEDPEEAIKDFLRKAAEELDPAKRGEMVKKLGSGIRPAALACLICVYYPSKESWQTGEIERALYVLLNSSEEETALYVRRLKSAKFYQHGKKTQGKLLLGAKERSFVYRVYPSKTQSMGEVQNLASTKEVEVWPPALPFGVREQLLAAVSEIDKQRQELEEAMRKMRTSRRKVETKLRSSGTTPEERAAVRHYLNLLTGGLPGRLDLSDF